MSTRFHLDKNGRAAECKATKKACPLGGEHYGSYEDALRASVYKEVGQDEKAAALALHESDPTPADSKYSYAKGEVTVQPLAPGVRIDAQTAELPAGTYFIGDPCYTAGSDYKAWDDWCAVALDDGRLAGANYGDYPVVGMSTAYGDGTYDGAYGTYPVDAGMIGAVPKELLDKMGVEPSSSDGRWFTFDEPFQVSWSDENGTISFGSSEWVETDPHDSYCEECGREISEWDKENYGLCEDCQAEQEEEEDLEEF